MKHPRKLRKLCTAATAALFVALAHLPTHADTYPSKPINFVVASSAGGILDTVGRVIARGMEKLGQPVVVQNIPGGGSSIGTAAVARAPADGYTIGMVATSHAINPSVYKKLPYNTLTDFTTVSHAVNITNVLIISTSVPANNLQEFIALAKREPGNLNCGSAGNGQSNHLSLEMFNMEASVKLNHIPYKGSSFALNDVIGGVLSCMFVDSLTVKQHIATGKVKALAISSKERVAELPSVPTFSEAGMSNFDANSWLAVVVHAGTAKDIVNKLGQSVTETMKDPEVRQRLQALGIVPMGTEPAQSQKFIEKEISRYATAAAKAGIKHE